MKGSREKTTLTLEVTRVAGMPPASPIRASFDPQGGSIGRREDNDWVLPDPQRFISSRHALISFAEGRYLVTDVSSNGVFLNHAESPLGSEGQAPLRQGDTLTIGEYEISVSLHQSVSASPDVCNFDALDDPYARLLDENAGIQLGQEPPSFDLGSHSIGAEADYSLDEAPPPDFENEAPAVAAPSSASASESDHVSDLDTYYSGPALIPEDWQVADGEGGSGSVASNAPADDGSSHAEPPYQAPSPGTSEEGAADPAAGNRPSGVSVPASAPAGEETLRRALAQGMGLSPHVLDELPLAQVLENLGRILRSNVEGAMSILRARSQMKSEFRMSQTMIRPVENNPLKFSINTEEALRHVVDPRPSSGYLAPLAAFSEAHEDTEAHMLAVMVGMQSALKAVLQRFKPENLQQRMGQSALLEKVPLYRRAKSWELFTELYSEIANEVEDDFQQVFGRAFSQAYEAQIRRLETIKNTNAETPTQNRN
ncbi:MAG: type VI secretion system-associated FHA domain protein TagH [Candidatus Thiodiazotropha sp.]